jgi:AraC family transcriptional regulator
VAFETGFAHQSHMAHWMNRLLGVTPRELVKASGRAVRIADFSTAGFSTADTKRLSR